MLSFFYFCSAESPEHLFSCAEFDFASCEKPRSPNIKIQIAISSLRAVKKTHQLNPNNLECKKAPQHNSSSLNYRKSFRLKIKAIWLLLGYPFQSSRKPKKNIGASSDLMFFSIGNNSLTETKCL